MFLFLGFCGVFLCMLVLAIVVVVYVMDCVSVPLSRREHHDDHPAAGTATTTTMMMMRGTSSEEAEDAENREGMVLHS